MPSPWWRQPHVIGPSHDSEPQVVPYSGDSRAPKIASSLLAKGFYANSVNDRQSVFLRFGSSADKAKIFSSIVGSPGIEIGSRSVDVSGSYHCQTDPARHLQPRASLPDGKRPAHQRNVSRARRPHLTNTSLRSDDSRPRGNDTSSAERLPRPSH
ncbi:hypothetical protein VTI28DRAFT_8713 [Corynascus sepedonium]